MGKDSDYFRKKNKENYEFKKKASDEYRRGCYSGESFSSYVRKLRKQKG